MKRLCLILTALFALALSASAQTTECPANMVCITPEAARKALETSDALIAEKAASAAKDQAIADLKEELNKLRIELARLSGEKTQMEQDRVRWTAVIDILIKNSRKKSVGLIAF